MYMPKEHQRAIYSFLLKEGVLVAKIKPVGLHQEIGIPNLHVLKMMQSLTSRRFVKEQYAGGFRFWFLSDEGISYIRVYLNLPLEVVPKTLMSRRESHEMVLKPKNFKPIKRMDTGLQYYRKEA